MQAPVSSTFDRTSLGLLPFSDACPERLLISYAVFAQERNGLVIYVVIGYSFPAAETPESNHLTWRLAWNLGDAQNPLIYHHRASRTNPTPSVRRRRYGLSTMS